MRNVICRRPKKYILAILLLIALLGLGSICYRIYDYRLEEQKQADIAPLQLPESAFEKIEIPITHLGKMECTEYYREMNWMYVEEDEKPTFTYWDVIYDDSLKDGYSNIYQLDLPEVDFERQTLLFSCGRKINSISYTEASRYHKYSSQYIPMKYDKHPPVGNPVMENEYHPNIIFLYVYDNQQYPFCIYRSCFYWNLFEIEGPSA